MLIIEMMARLKNRLSYGEKKAVSEIRLENGIIQGDAFSPLLFILMIDQLIKILKMRLGARVQILYYMDDLKESVSNIEIADNVDMIVKRYATSIGMVVNKKSMPSN